jgi:DHA2 family multidrug resistance protein
MVARQRFDAMVGGMMARGADAFTAKTQAMHLLDGLITRQAAVLAYDHVFVLVSALFVIGLPLVLLLRRGSVSGDVEIAVD